MRGILAFIAGADERPARRAARPVGDGSARAAGNGDGHRHGPRQPTSRAPRRDGHGQERRYRLHPHRRVGRSRTLSASPPFPPGAYELSAELAGFATALRKGVTLTLGAEAVLNFELSVASVTEQVSVTADTPVIETTTAAVQGTMRREQIDLLPVAARDYTNVIRLMPGAAANNSTYGFAGSRGRSNTWNVDGVDNSDEISGYAHQSPALDSIQEIQVLANGFKAEYGQASGGVVNVITRSGTNQLRGSGFALFQDESLRARSPYANRSQPEDPFQRIQYGATIGGPIQRDKMHFFGTYEREDRDTASISTRTLPASNGEFLGGDASVPAGGGRRPGAVRRGRRAAARAAGVRRRPQGDRPRRSAAQLESVFHRALAARRQEGAVRLRRHALRLQRRRSPTCAPTTST